ncbi:exosome non-catalytic core subunit RRP40 [Kluyveromyces lactis]|uniref:KLLA0E02091p n=1 Tax=Kluyveromyces lactis (strain ATCC 8585 / CBS 2359 / DSM 70799 / NBRC 1267 / NRRL Y-1140 / WM37) TaxID=284590 RepID=Q6CPU7_KLULA|nr:exosome complex component RRP40 [Kluyveromyces lactis]CAG99129.1 KLLA0E02091p [Kluyveromyces lactis]|eukprot:XP_454042.1 exosome complex component RRP40 [Kluyveromyces lactis]
MSKLLLPGDVISADETQSQSISAGPGIYSDPLSQEIKATHAGLEVVTPNKKGASVYVDYNSKRYIPAVGDFVVGVIVASFGDSYRVSLCNFSNPVTLSYMAFPNASKKNKPTLKVGDLCYARVCSAYKELEAEIECMDSSKGQDAGFGLLDGGMTIEVSLAYARELLFNDSYPLLNILGNLVEFEVAIGVNGIIWLKTDDVRTTLACYRSILTCQGVSPAQFDKTIKSIFNDTLKSTDEK